MAQRQQVKTPDDAGSSHSAEVPAKASLQHANTMPSKPWFSSVAQKQLQRQGKNGGEDDEPIQEHPTSSSSSQGVAHPAEAENGAPAMAHPAEADPAPTMAHPAEAHPAEAGQRREQAPAIAHPAEGS